MDITILDSSFSPLVIVDRYESLIWTDRYSTAGDFELYIPMPSPYFDELKTGNYIQIHDSESTMIIESLQITTSTETGDHLIVSGRSLVSLLKRRIVWNQTTFQNATVLSVVYSLIKKNITQASTSRQIPGFVLQEGTISTLSNATISAQYDGENLYDIVTDILSQYGVGIKVTLNASNQMVCSLYEGTDRTLDQTAVPFVSFSPEFDNIIESDYTENTVELRNVALIYGEGDGSDRKRVEVGTTSGLARREMKADSGSVSKKTDDGELTDAQYTAVLKEAATLSLSSNKVVNTFNGKVESSQLFVFGRDFYMGDKVSVENAYQLRGPARVTEMIISENENGVEHYPTFTAI